MLSNIPHTLCTFAHIQLIKSAEVEICVPKKVEIIFSRSQRGREGAHTRTHNIFCVSLKEFFSVHLLKRVIDYPCNSLAEHECQIHLAKFCK